MTCDQSPRRTRRSWLRQSSHSQGRAGRMTLTIRLPLFNGRPSPFGNRPSPRIVRRYAVGLTPTSRWKWPRSVAADSNPTCDATSSIVADSLPTSHRRPIIRQNAFRRILRPTCVGAPLKANVERWPGVWHDWRSGNELSARTMARCVNGSNIPHIFHALLSRRGAETFRRKRRLDGGRMTSLESNCRTEVIKGARSRDA
jgi:hypothetical protein